MSNILVVTEDGVITCPHGGKVVLSSSEPMVTCAGVKVMLVEDLVGAPIQGCPRHPPSGPTCTCVASVGASADTENNFTSKDGKKFLLRVGDCKTNCGESLILKDPGQDVWSIDVKPQCRAETVERYKAMRLAPSAEAIESIEGHSILPIRKSYDANILRPLRPIRGYREILDYYAFKGDGKNGDQSESDQTQSKTNAASSASDYKLGEGYRTTKISTYLDSRLYVRDKESGEVTEYLIINDSDKDLNKPLYEPLFSQVLFRNAKDNKVYRAIPCKIGKIYELFYSDIALPADDQDRFNSFLNNLAKSGVNYSKLKIDPDRLSCVRSLSLIAQTTRLNLEDDKQRKSIEKTKNETSPDDFEYNEANKVVGTYKFFAIANELRDKIADKKNLCFISQLSDPIGEIEDLYNDYEFSYFSSYAYNKTLFDSLKEINADTYAISKTLDFLYCDDDEQERFNKELKTLKKLYGELSSAVYSELGGAIIRKLRYLKDDDLINVLDIEVSERYVYALLFIDKDFFNDYDSLELRDGSDIYYYEASAARNLGRNLTSVYNRNRLTLNGDYEREVWEARALLNFSASFGGKYVKEREASDKLKKLIKGFTAQLKEISKYPQANIGAKVIEKAKERLQDQKAYKDIFSRTDPFLNEYESLDLTHKTASFYADKKYVDFKSLQCGVKGKEPQKVKAEDEILLSKSDKTADAKAKAIHKLHQEDRFLKVLELYQSKEFIDSIKDDDQKLLNYFQYMIGLFYNLIANRACYGFESSFFSPFAPNKTRLLEAFILLSKTLNEAPNITDRVRDLPIYERYITELFKALTFAKLMGDPLAKGVKRFLDEFKGNRADGNKEGSNGEKNESKEENGDPFYPLLKTDKERTDYESTLETLKNVIGYISDTEEVIEGGSEERSKTKGGTGETSGENNKKQIPTKTLTVVFRLAHISSFLMSGSSVIDAISNDKELKASDKIELISDAFLIVLNVSEFAKVLKERNFANIYKIRFFGTLSNIAVFKIFLALGVVESLLKAWEGFEEADFDDQSYLSIGTIAFHSSLAAIGARILYAIRNGVSKGKGNIYAMLAMIVASLGWEFLIKDRLTNKPIELYLKKSLFYKSYDVENSFLTAAYNLLRGGNFDAQILASSDNKDSLELHSANEVREYLAKIYNTDPSLYELSITNEISFLQSAICGHSIEAYEYSDDKTVSLVIQNNNPKYKSQCFCKSGVRLSGALLSSSKFYIRSPFIDPVEYRSLDVENRSMQGEFNENSTENRFDLTVYLINEATHAIAADPKIKQKAFALKNWDAIFEAILNPIDIIAVTNSTIDGGNGNDQNQIVLKYSLSHKFRFDALDFECPISISECKQALLTRSDWDQLKKLGVVE